MKHRTNRRDFLKLGALAGAGFWVAGGVSLAQGKAANDKLNFACIGVGGKGSSDTDNCEKHGNIVAICDIDDNALNGKAKKFPKAKKYNDYRKMLDEMGKEIDAVTVSTPDHSHAPASIMAMKLGKHVYCQKPLTHSVYEARLMREVAAQQKVATQMGNQGTAKDGFRDAVEAIQGGVVGPIREVHVWTNRCGGYWKQAPDIVARPKDTPKVPEHVHWDLFLGTAPERPYSGLYHPFSWRGWRDYGTGALGDMACHTANMAYMALKLGFPTSVVAQNSDVNPETFQQWATISYEFAARGDLPPVKLVWWEGVLGKGNRKQDPQNLPPKELFQGEKVTTSGSLFIGAKGTLYSPDDYGASHVLLPRKDFGKPAEVSGKLPRLGKTNEDQHQKDEWVAAIKGGPAPLANFQYGSMLTECMLLGNVAIMLGKKIEYDGAAMKCKNCPEADQYLKREYRKGWTL